MDRQSFLFDICFLTGCALFAAKKLFAFLYHSKKFFCDGSFKTTSGPYLQTVTFFLVSSPKNRFAMLGLTFWKNTHEVVEKSFRPKTVISYSETGFIAAVIKIFGNRTIRKDCFFITLKQLTKEFNWMVLLRLTRNCRISFKFRENFQSPILPKKIVPLLDFCKLLQNSTQLLIMSKSFDSKKCYCNLERQ